MTRYAVTLTNPGNKVPVFYTVRATPDTVVNVIFALPGVTPETRIEYQPMITRIISHPEEDNKAFEADIRAARQELYAEEQAEVRQERADRKGEL